MSANLVCVIGAISKHRLRSRITKQPNSFRAVRMLSLSDGELNWQSEGVDNDMNFGREAAAGATYPLAFAPPRAPAEC